MLVEESRWAGITLTPRAVAPRQLVIMQHQFEAACLLRQLWIADGPPVYPPRPAPAVEQIRVQVFKYMRNEEVDQRFVGQESCPHSAGLQPGAFGNRLDLGVVGIEPGAIVTML